MLVVMVIQGMLAVVFEAPLIRDMHEAFHVICYGHLRNICLCFSSPLNPPKQWEVLMYQAHDLPRIQF